MRPSLLSCSLALATLSLAHPTVRREPHQINKRADTTIYDADQTTPIAIPRIVVYVDEHNNQLEKKTETLHILPLSMKPTPLPQQSEQPEQPEQPEQSEQPEQPEQPELLDISETPNVPDIGIPPPPLVVGADTGGDDRNTQHDTLGDGGNSDGSDRQTQHNEIIAGEDETNTDIHPIQLEGDSGRETQHDDAGSDERQEQAPEQQPRAGGFGITYSPYTTGPCKTADQVRVNIDGLASAGYALLRLYGVDCDQVRNVHAAAKPHGMRLFLGIFDVYDIENGVATMAENLGGDWSLVDAVSVGNELVNNHQISPGELIGKIEQARQLLRANGFNGPVLTVDTFKAVQENPQLCASTEFCAINAHAFFDPSIEASRAGEWLEMEVQRTAAAIGGGKRIVVTETGWPWAGNKISPDSKAVPGVPEQAAALSAIRNTFGNRASDVFLFTAYNDDWKDPGPFGIEQSFGMGGPSAGNGI